MDAGDLLFIVFSAIVFIGFLAVFSIIFLLYTNSDMALVFASSFVLGALVFILSILVGGYAATVVCSKSKKCKFDP